MSRCVRGGTIYKRHKFKNGVCRCGVLQRDHLRAVANRREKRRAARKAEKESFI